MTDNTLKNKGTNAFVKHYPLSRDRFANYRRSTSEELLGVWRMYSHLPAWRRAETFYGAPTSRNQSTHATSRQKTP